jgi:hypothetical protein
MLSSVTARVRFAFAFAAAACLLVVFGVASARAASATTYANFNRLTYAYSTTLSTSQEANTYQVIALQANDAYEVPLLKAANPNLKILVYQATPAVENTTWAYNSCMKGPWVLANHPSWILHDQNNNPILAGNDYLTDVGNTSYQQTCVANAIATAKNGGFDGIFWDILIPKLTWLLPSGTSVPEYPTDASWQTAMYSMISYLGPQLHAHGLLAIGNIGGSANYPGLWQTWNGPLDGAMEEGWTIPSLNGTPAQGIWAWSSQLANVAWSEAHGKLALLHSYSTNQTDNTYGIASMMLVAGGESSYSTSNNCYSSCETWYPEYTTAQQLGAPLAAYSQLSGGVYERQFQNGIVLVNPTTNTIGPFSLGGTYSGSGLTNVTTVSMPPTTGYVLLASFSSGSTITTPPVNSALPAISGSAVQGKSLTVSTGTWSGSPTPTYNYQWNRCSTSAQSSCTPISGATSSGYTVQAADGGYFIDATVTASNSVGVAAASSAETAQVPVPTFSLSGSPSSAIVYRTHSTSFTISVTDLNGFAGSVALGVSGLPSGTSASFSSSSTATTSKLTVSASRSATLGTFTLTVSGTNGSQVKKTALTLTVRKG